MSKIYPPIDPEGLLEYSVVFNDRSLNHMSQSFQKTMRGLSETLKRLYHAEELAIVPGGGTVGMEAIARQFANDKRCLVIRNGWFSYRWTQIFDQGQIPSDHKALLAQQTFDRRDSPFAPPPLEEVLKEIHEYKPDLLFAAQVETAAGLILPNHYLKAVGDAVRAEGGLFIVDGIAAGPVWLNLDDMSVDIFLTAPQKTFSASPGAAIILFGERGSEALKNSGSTSFALDLQKWRSIMKAYEDGAHAYHATMPTDTLQRFYESLVEMEKIGFERLSKLQWELGTRVRALLQSQGFPSVAEEGFEAPTVVVSYTTDDAIQKGAAFAKLGLQTAAGVPLACKERRDYQSFRIGLFGLDKLLNPDRTVAHLEEALAALKADAKN